MSDAQTPCAADGARPAVACGAPSHKHGSAQKPVAADGDETRPGPRRNKGDLGRNEFKGERKRKKNEERSNEWREIKRWKHSKKGDDGIDTRQRDNPFSTEEIRAEERRPKRKVAVMIGYSGTGYKGMQVNGDDPTIERDLFRAFIAAGAISKANADDPRKSSLSRCARTDKGVHAAGNVISLKLIIEDEDVLNKINNALPPQIRVWGIQRTNNNYNCYQYCDSRWYEYLMPSYCLLPPHPRTYLSQRLAELNHERGAEEQIKERHADVADFWKDVDEKEIKPILYRLEPSVRAEVLQKTYVSDEATGGLHNAEKERDLSQERDLPETADTNPDEWVMIDHQVAKEADKGQDGDDDALAEKDVSRVSLDSLNPKHQNRTLGPFDFALRDIKAAYITAKKRYRVSPERVQRLQDVLNCFVGTHNFHNYTVQKAHSDPSAKRHIKSFVVNPKPIMIGKTEWLSLKVHGQSFMMHQIRKMVGLATLTVRCGTSLDRVQDSYGEQKMAIPKMPGLGLLLERPVFENYNLRAASQLNREEIDFSKYEDQLEKFKHEEIYTRIFATEEEEHSFHRFFNQIDQFKSNHFLWLSAAGMEAAHIKGDANGEGVQQAVDRELGDEDEDPEGGEG